jgi:dTDP-4-amino-4,6-dideoxygalactose transaminase
MNDSKLAIFGGEPVFNSKTLCRYKSIGDEEVKAVQQVVESGKLSGFVASWGEEFFGGPMIKKFEQLWAKKMGVKYAVSVNSNTSGLIASMGAIGIEPGDEVIVPPLSMSATAVAPLFYGGIPVFVDVDENSFCLDPNLVRKNITKKTKAIIAVNLFGQPAALHSLRKIADENNLYLIEDNAQSPLGQEHGKYTGSIGHIGVFSLNFHKHIHCGEGGVCTTSDDNLALRLQLIRNHAESIVEDAGVNDIHNLVGMNLRLTEMGAAVGIEQLKKSEKLIGRLENVAHQLNAGLGNLKGIQVPQPQPNTRHVYYMWQLRYFEEEMGINRETFAKALSAEGFPNFLGYLPPLYLLPLFQQKTAFGKNGYPFNLSDNIQYHKGICPIAERAHEKELLGFDICGYSVTDEQVELLIKAFIKVYENRETLIKLEKNNE